MTTTVQQIASAREHIEHLTDGPITPFVLMARATELAARKLEGLDAVVCANALYEALAERGWTPTEAEL